MLGKRIKDKRLELGFTQEQLGKMLGVSKVSVCNWEKGIKYPSTENLIELSKQMSVSIDYLIGNDTYVISEKNTDYSTIMSTEEIEVIKELRKHSKLHDALTVDFKRTIDLIERKIY